MSMRARGGVYVWQNAPSPQPPDPILTLAGARPRREKGRIEKAMQECASGATRGVKTCNRLFTTVPYGPQNRDPSGENDRGSVRVDRRAAWFSEVTVAKSLLHSLTRGKCDARWARMQYCSLEASCIIPQSQQRSIRTITRVPGAKMRPTQVKQRGAGRPLVRVGTRPESHVPRTAVCDR